MIFIKIDFFKLALKLKMFIFRIALNLREQGRTKNEPGRLKGNPKNA